MLLCNMVRDGTPLMANSSTGDLPLVDIILDIYVGKSPASGIVDWDKWYGQSVGIWDLTGAMLVLIGSAPGAIVRW